MDEERAPLTPDEARQLSARIRAGDRAARAEFVASLLGWLHQWADRARRLGYRAEEVEELIQELALDLAEHAAAYDPERGMPTTWAAIRFRATYTRWSRRARHPGGLTQVAPGRIGILSLDAPLYDEDGHTLGDRLAAPSGPVGRLEGARLDRALAMLRPREREAIERRTGWGGTAPVRLQGIADTWGCSREYVHQVENRGLARMRRALDVPEPATSPRRVPVRRAA